MRTTINSFTFFPSCRLSNQKPKMAFLGFWLDGVITEKEWVNKTIIGILAVRESLSNQRKPLLLRCCDFQGLEIRLKLLVVDLSNATCPQINVIKNICESLTNITAFVKVTWRPGYVKWKHSVEILTMICRLMWQ